MNNRFPRILQIAMIVRDVDAAVKCYEDEFGIGPWEVLDFGPDIFPKMLVDEKPGMVEMRCAFCKCYGFEMELIQPVSQSKYMEHLEKYGPGLHHIAAATPNGKHDFHGMIKEQREKGRDTWIWLKEDNGKDGEGMEAAYLDLREQLGLIVEIYNEDK